MPVRFGLFMQFDSGPATLQSHASLNNADLILRDAFVELLLSYQLPWLQLGLEVVLGVKVVLGVEVHKARLATGRDGQLVRLSTLSTLKTLIAQRMLADPAISQRYGTTGTRLAQGRAREAMLQKLRAHLLERFLCLVALLDHAKHLEVLPRRRPLFRPSAAVKSSAEVLIEFAKAYMASEGNLAKHLASLGYRVRLAYYWAGHVVDRLRGMPFVHVSQMSIAARTPRSGTSRPI